MPGTVQGMEKMTQHEIDEMSQSEWRELSAASEEAATRWVEQLTGEDKRVRDVFLAEYGSLPELVGCLTDLIVYGRGPEVAVMPSSAIELVKEVIERDIAAALDLDDVGDTIRDLIETGSDWPLGDYKRAADALGLDYDELVKDGFAKVDGTWRSR